MPIPTLAPFRDDLPLPPVIKPVSGHLTLTAVEKQVKLHRDLPRPATVWGYQETVGEVVRRAVGATFLGPTVEVQRGETVSVTWKNGIHAETVLPYEVIKANSDDATNFVAQNVPGNAGAIPPKYDTGFHQAKRLQAALVTHLHGGRTQADYDGWPDNTALSEQAAHYTYHNDQAGTMLWYHDHAMHVTRLNVYAGLAGVWLIRDGNEEKPLHLPHGEFEIPLVIQDRNLATDKADQFTGQLLHKVEVNGGDGPAEFFGPYTLVNGKIWPKAPVKAALYRLRLLNGSNARTYRLVFLDQDGNNLNAAVWQIGSDQGLLDKKVALPETGLILMPAERADVLIDLSDSAEKHVYLWNTADAPFGNEGGNLPSSADITTELKNVIADPLAVSTVLNADKTNPRRPYGQVMRFDVGEKTQHATGHVPEKELRPARPNPHFDDKTQIRIMALVEEPAPNPSLPDATTMLVFWEFVPVAQEPAPPGALVVSFTYWHPGKGVMETRQYGKAAENFYDQVNWFAHVDATELWYIVNLSGDSHPVHVHLVDFEALFLSPYTWNGIDPAVKSFDPSVTLTNLSAKADLDIEPNRAGPKDTVRVDPGQMLGIALKFSPFAGRYMYHCHILEHEDHDMMRPFVVVPEWVPHHDH